MTLYPVSTLRSFPRGWLYQEYKTPADIARGVMETRKVPHHDKVVTPYRAGTSEFGPIFVSLGIPLALFLYTLVF